MLNPLRSGPELSDRVDEQKENTDFKLCKVCAKTKVMLSFRSRHVRRIKVDKIPHFSMENGGTPFPNEGQTIWKGRIHE